MKLRFYVANIWFQRKIKRFVLTSPQSISCGQRNNGTWFTLMDEFKFNLFGSDDKRFARRKNGKRLSLQCIKKTVKFEGRSIIVWGMISSAGVRPIVRFHSNINARVFRELLRQHAFSHLRKGTVENLIFIQERAVPQS